MTSPETATVDVALANATTVARMFEADPVLEGVAPLREVVPELPENMVLTSGAPSPVERYRGGQRRAVCYAAVYEGLAPTAEAAEAMLQSGELLIGACQDYGCVGSLAGIYTGSMPVFVVRNRTAGNVAYCNFYEGESRRRLNYGVYDEEVEAGLRLIERVLAPVIGSAIEHAGEIALKPIMRRALNMGDELHSRNTAGSLLFTRELFAHLVAATGTRPDDLRRTIEFLSVSDYFFLRLSMAAAKATADAAHGVVGSSVVTGMVLSGHDFAIRVGGLGDDWIRGPLPSGDVKLFDGYTEDDIEYMGGESCMTECIGLGGFAQAAAPALQAYQGGTASAMVATTLRMYDITTAENPDWRIPFLDYRGTPTGIDVFKVLATGALPVIDGGLAGKDGGQIGAGILRPPMECFEEAARRLEHG
jgi:Protein of unknown function (DUF1116)